jgi:hypothetical protein
VPQAPVETLESFTPGEEFEVSTFEPSPRASSAPVALEAGEIISTSWAIFKSQMWLLIGAVVGVFLLTVAANFIVQVIGGILGVTLGAAMRMGAPQIGGGNNPWPFVLVQVIQFALFVPVWIFQIYLSVGQTILFLKIARGQPAEFGDIFRGGPYVLRAIGSGLLFGLMVGFGFILLIVPGVILALMFWPFMYVLVDTDPPGMQCLSRAMEITRNTWGTIILLWLTAFGLGILGVLACCFGVLFTAPLSMLLFAVVYCRMTGQPTANV